MCTWFHLQVVGVSDEKKLPEDVCEKVVVEVPGEPMDFMCSALEAGHPRSIVIHLLHGLC